MIATLNSQQSKYGSVSRGTNKDGDGVATVGQRVTRGHLIRPFGIDCVRTHWIRGSWRSSWLDAPRIVMLMVPG
jgi:hypothetical protein